MDKPLWGLRVQAPFGARVLSFVCYAPNDGFGPQSGLVQRVVLYAAAWGSENRPTGLRSGGRRLAVRTAMEHPIGALPCTPFPASRDFAPVGSMSLDFQVASLSYKSSSFATSRGNERYEEKTGESYALCTISAFPPLWWLAPPPCPVGSMSLDSRVAGLPYESSSFATPASGGTIKLREAIFFIKWFYAKHGLFCSRLRGKSRAAGKGGGERSEPITECQSCQMTKKGYLVTLTL